ncbi:MAG: hypothetical protein LBR79_07020 [Oscillospiraceae bacterium]|nr:hypothetical protein [Oscillospiraceae bacterium]
MTPNTVLINKLFIRTVRKFYRLQSKSTTAYEDTSREILMQSHFLSDAFFR